MTRKKEPRSLPIRLSEAFMKHARKDQTTSRARSSQVMRSNYRIALSSILSVFLYFLLVFFYIYMNDIASGGNTAMFFVLVGAVFVALLGAFYSSNLTLFVKRMTPSGRREKFMSEQRGRERVTQRRDSQK